MTDRIQGFTVTLETDMRTDDVEFIANAIRAIRGVASVEGSVVTSSDHMARMRVRSEIRRKLWEAIDKVFDEAGEGKGT